MNDQRDTQRMDKKQELRRNFRLVSTIGFTSFFMGTWEVLLTSNNQGLRAGGRPGLFWSLVWSYCGQTFIVLSMAEMSSMATTAGGQYHWVSEFAPRKYQGFLSYVAGWFSTLTWQNFIARACYLIGIIVQGLIYLGDSAYIPARWQATLPIIAAPVGVSIFNIFAAKHLPLAEGIFVTFMVGQVTGSFTVLEETSDSVAHMAEEIENASIIVPQLMVWAFVFNIPPTFAVLLAYLFTMPDVQEALDSSTSYPFIHVFLKGVENATSAMVMVAIILLLLIMVTISGLASESRQTFVFAHDQGLPFSSFLGTVHPTLHIPANSIIFTFMFSLAMSLTNIGSTVAFNALVSLSTVALMATYLISFTCLILRRVYCNPPLPPCRCFWPILHDASAVNFNWAPVLFVGVMGASTVVYWLHARKVYEGTVAIVEGGKY
ncbi:amino acid permease-domain-containing protein [Aspergillus alliaceus]|uniref:amino acid permease-domain-containing protein n=1 Tax=Petromyces alliaceus TaxID=209559 RepID=UPI0012A3BA2D|nr:amino acid permease-domain-containing protein [Aspergillus alliaceus]KAB8229631.1 amino acid permease-domain-containing protein [Aspergillus alliaceus]